MPRYLFELKEKDIHDNRLFQGTCVPIIRSRIQRNEETSMENTTSHCDEKYNVFKTK